MSVPRGGVFGEESEYIGYSDSYPRNISDPEYYGDKVDSPY